MYDNLPMILAVSLMLTLLLETLFALIAGIRTGRSLALVALVNTLTNPPVVLIYTLFPSLPMKLALEIAAILIEWLIYKKCAENMNRPLLFSLSANLFSYFMGEVISRLLPLLF